MGLLECARRLNLALDTVKRYARPAEPDRLIRTPQYRPTLVDAYRDYLCKRRATDPALPATHLLAEIREIDYTGSASLLVLAANSFSSGVSCVATLRPHPRRRNQRPCDLPQPLQNTPTPRTPPHERTNVRLTT